MDGLFHICKAGSTLENQFNVIHYIKRLKKSHMITLTDAEKAFETLQYKFMIKNSWETRIKRKLPELDKGHLQKPTALIIL